MVVDPRNEPGAGMLVRALFHHESEIQTGRMLDVALQQDLGNGVKLARALLGAVADGPGARAAAGLLRTMPSELRAWTEVPLHDLRIGQAQRHDKHVGWVDLVLQDPAGDWVLAVELKVGARYHDGQLETYSGLGIPIVGLVMTPSPTRAEHEAPGPGWLGEATWSQIRDDLYSLAWPIGGEAIWVEFLDTFYAARADRDRTDDDLAADALLRDLVPQAASKLRQLLEIHCPDGRNAVHHDVILDQTEENAPIALGAFGPTPDVEQGPFALLLTVDFENGRLSDVVVVWESEQKPPQIASTRPYERYVVGAITSEKALVIPVTSPEVRELGQSGAALRALEPVLRVAATDLWGA